MKGSTAAVVLSTTGFNKATHRHTSTPAGTDYLGGKLDVVHAATIFFLSCDPPV